ncbi:MAG: MazG nucleotide pyrophosphohydrolase domain-containing protein [Gammaproteobacteria bacterium]
MKYQQASLLEGVPPDLTQLACAMELQRRAASAGFDWDQLAPVLAKIREELAELEMEISLGGQPGRKQDELGDVLFAVANLARKLEIDPEQALRGTNQKFLRRFSVIETELAKRGKRPENASLEEMDAIWEHAKGHES